MAPAVPSSGDDMASIFKKRAFAGPAIGEKRQEQVLRETLGNKKPADPPRDQWMKHQCRCGFLMGYVFVPKDDKYFRCWGFNHECVGCHEKRKMGGR